MSDDNAPSPESAKELQADGAPRVRRISNPRIKKPAKSAVAPSAAPEDAPQPEESSTPASAAAAKTSKFPEFLDAPERPEPAERREKSAPSRTAEPGGEADSSQAPESSDESSSRSDWPEPEAPSSGAPSENNKRKRRRKKGKGGNSNNGGSGSQGETEAPQSMVSDVAEATTGAQLSGSGQGHQPRQSHPQAQHAPQSRPRLDPDLLAKFAWKIYLAEVSEEGVALVGDSDAKELSRRCFRLAEIFMEEQARRR